jgi:hypothetical protein
LKILRPNSLLVALLDQFAPMRTYNRLEATSLTWCDDAVLSTIQDRNCVYSSYKSSRSPENWDRFRSLRNRARQVIRSAKWRFTGRFLDLTSDPKIRSFGLMGEGSDNVALAFSADELTIYFTSPAAGTDSSDLAHVTYCPLIEDDSFSSMKYVSRLH